MHPWFVPALTDKAALLAANGEWEQALDAAQRALDVEPENIDALRVVAVHAFTQESQPHDALHKLEDFDVALINREPSSAMVALETAALFGSICSRQPRALQICVRMLERAQKHCSNAQDDARLLCQLGQTQLMQGIGQYDNAMRSFREASKRDPDSVPALEGMVLCQLCEGLFEDAEAQIELLTVMHNADELSPEFSYLQAMLAKHRFGRKDARRHLQCLDECRERFFRRANCAAPSFSPFADLILQSPDFVMRLAVDYLGYMDSPTPTSLFGNARGADDGSSSSGNNSSSSSGFGSPTRSPSKNKKNSRPGANFAIGMGAAVSGGSGGGATVEVPPAVQTGMELLNKVRRIFYIQFFPFYGHFLSHVLWCVCFQKGFAFVPGHDMCLCGAESLLCCSGVARGGHSVPAPVPVAATPLFACTCCDGCCRSSTPTDHRCRQGIGAGLVVRLCGSKRHSFPSRAGNCSRSARTRR